MTVMNLTLEEFLQECAGAGLADVRKIERIAVSTVRHLKGSARAETAVNQDLERRWYASLSSGVPDYGVYDTEDYVAELWACWSVYSRKCVTAVRKIAGTFGDVRHVLDLGCGCGLTSAALRDIWPAAEVSGTNLAGTTQWSLAERFSTRYGFRLAERAADVGAVDLALASEYFEHFHEPIEHLREVVAASRPRAFVIANAFGAKSIGHFDEYAVTEELLPVSGSVMGRRFNAEMRRLGYRRAETGFWNNRPAVWIL